MPEPAGSASVPRHRRGSPGISIHGNGIHQVVVVMGELAAERGDGSTRRMTMTDTTSTIDVPGYKAGTWVLDPSHSEVTFSVRHMMISKVRGTFGMKSAPLIAPANPLDAKVQATVDVT